MTLGEALLSNFGGTSVNSLTHILEFNNVEENSDNQNLIYIIIRDCTRVGAFPREFCVPNSVALASLTLQVVYWTIH